MDRYGATPLSEFFIITEEELEKKLGESITLIEAYEEDTIECLIKSIPIKEITSNMPKDTKYFKMEASSLTKEKYNINILPSLLIFNNKKFKGKIEGYYNTDQKQELLDQINNTL